MLHSLEGTGLGAKLQSRAYEAYQMELKEIEGEWGSTLHFLDSCDFSFRGGIKNSKIPSPSQEVSCPAVWRNGNSQRIDEEYLSSHQELLIAEGGSVPCTFQMILKYLNIAKDLESICGVLLRNDYRIKDGTLILAFDKILEQIYGVKTEIQPSVFHLCESVSKKRPVIGLVSTAWLSDNELPGNTCIIIWQLKGKKLLVSTTTSGELQVLDMYDTFKHIQRAWACYK